MRCSRTRKITTWFSKLRLLRFCERMTSVAFNHISPMWLPIKMLVSGA